MKLSHLLTCLIKYLYHFLICQFRIKFMSNIIDSQLFKLLTLTNKWQLNFLFDIISSFISLFPSYINHAKTWNSRLHALQISHICLD